MTGPSPGDGCGTFPDRGRLAGVDFGTVRIGVAICDVSQSISSPAENYTRRTMALDADFFQRLTQREQIVGFVVGLPVYPSGDESPKSREARTFGDWLATLTERPVCFHDERYTSSLAEDLLGQAGLSRKRRQERLDKLAAHLILQTFLESKQSRSDHFPPLPLDG